MMVRCHAEVGRGADLLSHEATFSQNMAHKAHKAQHSTAEMAGRFARQIGASTLILTHFSSRYSALGKGSQDKSPRSQVSALKAFVWSVIWPGINPLVLQAPPPPHPKDIPSTSLFDAAPDRCGCWAKVGVRATSVMLINTTLKSAWRLCQS